ncbi:unnamed protein product [Schistocephalus solidus]|uniref:Uncharacterized protein n=1 Tax=Schistocephalus solidus TaxID=70667 RepID=A0A183SBB4_SCHSO|nr:unnamed protein product [Schistocephalus solidus]
MKCFTGCEDTDKLLLLLDLTITITKKETAGRNADHFQPNYPKTLHETNAGRPPITASFGHYTAHVRFSGSRVGRSSKGSPAVPADTTTSGPRVGLKSLGTNESFDLDYTPSGDDGRLKRIRRQTPARALPRQGLLVVIVQFSDGSMLPWHRIMEVSRRNFTPLYFLALSSLLCPTTLFEITGKPKKDPLRSLQFFVASSEIVNGYSMSNSIFQNW